MLATTQMLLGLPLAHHLRCPATVLQQLESSRPVFASMLKCLNYKLVGQIQVARAKETEQVDLWVSTWMSMCCGCSCVSTLSSNKSEASSVHTISSSCTCWQYGLRSSMCSAWHLTTSKNGYHMQCPRIAFTASRSSVTGSSYLQATMVIKSNAPHATSHHLTRIASCRRLSVRSPAFLDLRYCSRNSLAICLMHST